MGNDDSRVLSNVIQIDDERIRGHLDRISGLVLNLIERGTCALARRDLSSVHARGRYSR